MLMMGEWWASEAIIFMAGSLVDPENTVSAMSIYQNTLSICFMMPSRWGLSFYISITHNLVSYFFIAFFGIEDFCTF